MLLKIFKQVAAFATKPTKLALIVRSDIKMSKGKTAAQCAHAAVMCYHTARESKDQNKRSLLDTWTHMGQPKIVLRVDSYEELMKLQKLARDVNLTAEIVCDAGRTQLKAGTATVLGLGPGTVDDINKLVAHLKLL